MPLHIAWVVSWAWFDCLWTTDILGCLKWRSRASTQSWQMQKVSILSTSLCAHMTTLLSMQAKLAGRVLYYLLTTGAGLQTLGEEYCAIVQVHFGRTLVLVHQDSI